MTTPAIPADMPQLQRGRPSKYSPDIAEEICALIACGVPATRLHRENERFPDWSNIVRWLTRYPDFRVAYSRARLDQADCYADQVVEISDDTIGADSAAINSARLRCDARRWAASKLNPKKYGDTLAMSGDITVTHDLADRLARAMRIDKTASKAIDVTPDSAAASNL